MKKINEDMQLISYLFYFILLVLIYTHGIIGSVMSLKLCSSSGLIFLMIGFETGELRMMVLMAEDEPDRWIEVRTFKLHREPIFSIDLNIKDNRTLEKFNDDMGDGGRIVCWSVGADSVIGRYQVDFQKTKNHQDESIQEIDPSKFIVSLEGHIVLFKFKVLSNTSDQSKKNGKEEEIDYNEARFDVKVRSDGKLFSTIDREGKIEIYSTLLLKNKSPSENEKNEARSDRLQGEEKCFDCQRLKLIGVLKNKAYINYRVGISTDKQQQQESNKLKNQVLAFSEVFERSNREAERNLECGKPKFDRRFGNSMVSLVGDHDLEFRNLLACSSNNSYGNIVVWEVF
ncbi:hypothetical protein BY996DRAFT_7050658 [Phakopsora pachyrhizi]|nr:hypothetical protein BY996DRAFT_7050658 [Phakopsora pachyrhizi]